MCVYCVCLCINLVSEIGCLMCLNYFGWFANVFMLCACVVWNFGCWICVVCYIIGVVLGIVLLGFV